MWFTSRFTTPAIGVIHLPTTVQDQEDDAPWQPVCSACVSTKGGAAMTPPTRPTAPGERPVRCDAPRATCNHQTGDTT